MDGMYRLEQDFPPSHDGSLRRGVGQQTTADLTTAVLLDDERDKPHRLAMTWPPPNNNHNAIKSKHYKGNARPAVSAPVVSPSPRQRFGNNRSPLSPPPPPPHPNKNNGNDDGWRTCGKRYRANLVLGDEANGDNKIALSSSCSIERYYRVVDRVLEQFLNSNIAEPNEMVETFLVGNRLFKFLSVVLPTHSDYFSPDPHLFELRSRSQSQLIELLEYMEELELMIDEMEYNKYILQDLTPSPVVAADDTASTANNTTISSLDCDGSLPMMQDFVEGSTPRKRDTTNIRTQPNPPTRYSMPRGLNTSTASVESNSMRSQGVNLDTSNGSIAASQMTEGSSSQRSSYSRRVSRKEAKLERKVAAVVNAAVNATAIDSQTRHSKKRTSSSSAMLLRKSAEHRATQRSPIPEEKPADDQQQQKEQQLDQAGNDESWANFDRESPLEPEGAFVERKSRIDLLILEEESPPKREPPSNVIKIKQPRDALPRDVRAVHAARYSSAMDLTMDDSTSLSPSFLSEGSGDIFYSLEDSKVKPPVKTKIEERLERAGQAENQPLYYDHPSAREFPSDDHMPTSEQGSRRCFNSSPVNHSKGRNLNDDKSLSLIDESYGQQRKLGHQFRGCVKSLIS